MSRVVLVSGGADSAVCLRLAARDHHTIGVVVDYGQQNRTEIVLADDVIKLYGSRVGVLVRCPLPERTGLISGSVNRGRSVNQIGAPGDKPKAYTPGRNTMLLSIAMHVAESRGADEIWIGSNKDDREGYPDCRREYFDAFEAMCATLGKPIRVRAPLIDLTKRQVVALGRELDVDFAHTSSCYFGTACGECDACVLMFDALTASESQ